MHSHTWYICILIVENSSAFELQQPLGTDDDNNRTLSVVTSHKCDIIMGLFLEGLHVLYGSTSKVAIGDIDNLMQSKSLPA